jgi:hypothetical protein
MNLSNHKSVVFALYDNNLSKKIMDELHKMCTHNSKLNSKVIYIDKKTSRIDVLAKNNSILIGINLNTDESIKNNRVEKVALICDKPKAYYDQYYKKINLISFQRHLASKELLNNLELNGKSHLSLGLLNADINSSERIFRTSNFVNFDLKSIKFSNRPSDTNSNPAGLSNEQFIQLSKLAGYSDNISFLNFEIDEALKESTTFTSKLIATCIWYFLESLIQVASEDKLSESMSLVEIPNSEDFVYFYKSDATGKCSYTLNKDAKKEPCSLDEYDMAVTKGIIGERILTQLSLELDIIL